jgi:hypothetical protein
MTQSPRAFSVGVRPFPLRATLLSIAIVSLVTLTYFSFYWNRFAGLRSGSGSFVTGTAFLSGLRPYRDYFTASTPLNILSSATALRIFGDAVIVTRAFGVFERTIIGILLVVWLMRLFPTRFAVMGAIVAIIVSAGDISDPIASYNHETMLWGIACGLSASFVLSPLRSRWPFPVCSLLSGILAGLCFCSKQTIGLGITVGVPVVVFLCLLQLHGIRRAISFLVAFCAGWAATFCLLMIWLSDLGVLKQFFLQVFVQGPAAKAGRPTDFVIRFLRIALYLRLAVAVGAVATLYYLTKLLGRERDADDKLQPYREIAWLGAIAIACIWCGVAAANAGWPGVDLRKVSTAAIYFTFFSITLSLAYYSWIWLKHQLTAWGAQAFVFLLVAFACAFMLSLSYPVFEAMALPGLGFLIAMLLTRTSGWQRISIFAGCFVMLVIQAELRLNSPFGFERFHEGPVRVANMRSNVPQMHGLLLPEETVRFVDTSVRIISSHAGPADTVFTYPELGLIYALSDRWPPTATLSHNIDVVNDQMARQEAQRLLAHPPAVLIFYKESDDLLKGQDILWRSGRRSGQRDIIDAVEKLAATYDVAATFENLRTTIYTRPGSVASPHSQSSAADGGGALSTEQQRSLP